MAYELQADNPRRTATGRALCLGRRLRHGWPVRLPWPAVLFLAFFGLYLERCVNLRLVFWNQNDLFLWNLRFARGFAMVPGQPCQWLGKLLLQSCYYGWPGALVVAALAGVVLAAAGGILERVARGGRTDHAWRIPAVLLVVLHSQYAFNLSTVVALAFALTGGLAYVRATSPSGWVRGALFVAWSLPVYYLAGGTYFVFVACCLIYESLTGRRYGLGLCLLALALVVKFGIDRSLSCLHAAYPYSELPEISYLVPGDGGAWGQGLLVAYVPVGALFLAIRRDLALLLQRWWAGGPSLETSPQGTEPDQTIAGEAAAKVGDQPPTACPVLRIGPPGWRAIVTGMLAYLLLAIAGVAGVKAVGLGTTKHVLELDFASRNHHWQQVLQAARRLPPNVYADCANQDVNVALYHLGRLPYDMFAYPQWSLFVEHGFGARGRLYSRKAFDLFFELGRVNEAEGIAHNDLENHPSAECLIRISRTKTNKGLHEAARLYLNVLRDDLTFGDWAEAGLKRLREDPVVLEPEIVTARSLMLIQDDVDSTQVPLPNGKSSSFSAEQAFLSLLERNPRNRMAFEYLMASHLLSGNVVGVVAELPRLKDFAYPGTPLLYEEAALLYAGKYRDQLVTSPQGTTVSGCPISAETVARYQHLAQIGITHQGFDNSAAQQAVWKDLGPTYFFFFLYGRGTDDE